MKIKNLLLISTVIFSLIKVSYAQSDSTGCFTMQRAELFAQTDTSFARKYAELFRVHAVSLRSVNQVITIPVVVHIVYNNSLENISQLQVQSAIDVLNEDYRMLNPNLVNTNPAYINLAADCEINFCLVGTTRTYTSYQDFPVNSSLWTNGDVDYVKDLAPGYGQGYLNIWVCDIQGSMYGYAVFPGMAPQQYDGITVDYQYFGRTGIANTVYAGRTVTHEVGHWLGLLHIWGSLTGTYGSYCDDDYVADTYPQHRPNPNMCNYDYTSCPNYGPGYIGPYSGMNENFMDYSQGACMTFFTLGQKQRITAMILTYRYYLIASPIPCNTYLAENLKQETEFNYDHNTHQLNFVTTMENSGAQLKIYNLSGKEVFADDRYTNQRAGTFTYYLPYLCAGTYIIDFYCADQYLRRKLIIL